MNSCLKLLEGEHDFAGFEATGSRIPSESGRGAVRRIFTAQLTEDPAASRCCIELQGDGFLRHMVRNIVGTVVEVGQGRRTMESFKKVLASGDRTMAGPTAPACGLFLKEVAYSL